MVFFINIVLIAAITVLLIIQVKKFKLIHKIVSSFDNSPDGFSARKLSAFVGVIVSVIATFRFVDNNTIIDALMVWLVFALLCLGIITAEQLLRAYKTSKNGDDKPAESLQETTEETSKKDQSGDSTI